MTVSRTVQPWKRFTPRSGQSKIDDIVVFLFFSMWGPGFRPLRCFYEKRTCVPVDEKDELCLGGRATQCGIICAALIA